MAIANHWEQTKWLRPRPSIVLAREEHWRRTRSLMWVTLAIWFFFSFVIHFFVMSLNQIVILGFPLGFYMAAQGSLIAFVILLFWFAYRQNKIDEECGVEEEEGEDAMATRGGFVENLGKIYGIYTGGFIAFVILMAILEQLGVPNRVIGYLFIGFTIAIYAMIGIISRTTEISEYYVAGRRVPAFYNGMATGADWMSAASFISMAGTLYVLGYDGLGYVLGWTGGYVLVAILLAPYLRKFGIFTVPDFLGTRYEGHLPRLLGIIVLFCASFTYIVAQIVGVGIVTSRFLQIPFGVAVFVGLAGILVCSMLGGMRAVTWTQVAQYIILIIAYILPVAILSAQLYGLPIPQLTYGQALQRIGELEQELGVAKAHVAPFLNLDSLNFFALILCLMIGTASLPHILMRYFTTPTVRDARKSVAWSLFFIFLLYFTAPAYAAFAKLEIYQNVIGQTIADLPIWVANWGTVGLVTICDAVDAGATIANCVRNGVPVNGNGDGILQLVGVA